MQGGDLQGSFEDIEGASKHASVPVIQEHLLLLAELTVLSGQVQVLHRRKEKDSQVRKQCSLA